MNYDDLARELPATPSADPYDELLAQDKVEAMRINAVAPPTNPDAEARLQQLARKYGLPAEAVRLAPDEVERKERLGRFDYDRLARELPATSALLADGDKSKVVHDDVDNLSSLESVLNYLTPGNKNTLYGAVGAGMVRAKAGVFGAARAAFDAAAPVLDPLVEWRVLPGNPLRGVAEGYGELSAQDQAFAKTLNPPQAGIVAGGISSGIESFTQNTLLLPLAFLPGGQPVALGGMAGMAGGNAYQQAREQGLPVSQALPFAAAQGGIEYLTEKIPVSRLIGDVGRGVSLPKMLARQITAEVPGEQVATVWQDLNEWAVLPENKDKPFSAYLAERPSAAAQTLIATIVGTGGNVALVRGIDRVVTTAEQRELRAQQAAQSDTLARLGELAKASKVLQRDPETFQQFVAQATEGTPLDTVYIDGQVLHQSGLGEQLAAVSPAVAAQLEQAVQTGGAVAIPVDEYVTRIAATDLNTQLMPHLRTEADGFSQAEAKQWLDTQGEQLQADLERAQAEAQQGDAFRASADAVTSQIRQQLDAAGRFTPQVNESYAALVGAYYATRAAALGITPEALYQRRMLTVNAQSPLDGNVLNQGGPALDEVLASLQAQGIDARISERRGIITVFKIIVPEPDRGTGKGTAAMQALVDYADQTGQHLALTPSSDFGGNKKRLVEFYKRFGFVENKGKNRAFTTSEAMYRQAPGKVLHQSGLTPTAQAVAKWQTSLRHLSPRQQGSEARMPVPAVIQSFGEKGPRLSLPVRVLQAIRQKHPDVPLQVFEDLPALLSDPLYVWPHREGGVNVAIDATTAAGEPIIVGVREGRVRTVTPYNDVTPGSGRERLLRNVGEALGRSGTKVYARQKENLAEARSPASGQVRTDPAGAKQKLNATVTMRDQLVKKHGPDLYQGSNAPRGSFSPDRLAITLLKGADLSTFLHEGGHFFFENDIALASEIVAAQREGASITAGEQQLLDDVGALLTWHGLKGQSVAEQLTEWHSMPFEEQRTHHERTAESFERYLLDGKAPSVELAQHFQRFRAWLLNVYRSLRDFLAGHPEAGTLTPEVRGVFDRMLASNEAILAAEHARSMLPLFETAEQGGMSSGEWAAYQAQGNQSTQDAVQDLQARALRDLQWLRNARSRELKKRQRAAKGLRREMAIEVRQEMMGEPVYRAWRFLTAKVTDEDRLADLPEAPKTGTGPLNRETDSLLVAIAKLGGISREAAAEHLGVHKDDFRRASGVFGKPLFRAEGGLSADAMAELLASEGYLVTDENGLADLRELEELVADELGGTARYSVFRDPALAALDEMRPGDQAVNPQALGAGRLDVDSLRDLYGTPAKGQPVAWKKLSDHRMTASKGGMHPQFAADLLGFDSGDALVQALQAATPFEDEVQARVDQRMLEQHGELATPEALERAADEAIHNEARGRMVATELAALAKATGSPKVLADAARQYAAAAIARLKVRDVRPAMYSNAQARAARNAAAAMKQGDVQTAAAEKRNELLQHYSAKAAADARDEVESGRKYLAKFDKRIKSLDAEYQDLINAMLERYDLSRASLTAVDKRKSLAAWVEAQREQGLEPDIAPELLNEAQRQSWRDMTVEDFRGLVDAVRQIEHLGRLKNKLLVAAEQRDFEAVLGELVAGIAKHAGSATPEQSTPATDEGVRKLKWHQFFLSHLKVANITQVMDGGETGGPVWSFFARSAQEQANWKQAKQAELTEKLMGIMRPVLTRAGQFRTARVRPALGISLTQEQVFAIALNMGNEGNLSRLTTGGIAGRHFTEPQLRQLIETEMTAEDLNAVQAIWDLMAELTPEAQAKHKRIYGVEMKLIEPLPLVTKHGTLRGGYYPIVYDPRGSSRIEGQNDEALAKDALRAAHTAATTRRSYTKARLDETPYPLLLTMGGVHQGLSQVVHDLAWHEWSMDTGKMLRSREFQDAVRGSHGPDYLNSLRNWHEDIVTENVREQAGWERFGVHLRASVSSAAMGYSLLTAIQQPIGLTQSMARLGAGQVFKAVAAFMGSPRAQIDQARELSAFMRNRSITRFREVADLKRQIDLTGNKVRAAHAAVAEHAFDLLGWVQTSVDVPTWHAAFEKATAEGQDQDTAVVLADQAVIDTQGDGAIQNLSAVQRDRFGKWLTVFYSYLSSALNMTWQTARSERSLGRKTVDLLLLTMIPATLTAIVKWSVKPGDDDDDEDAYWKLVQQILKENISLPLSMFVGIRELSDQAASLMVGEPVFSYQGPGSFRMVAETAKLLGQVQQGEVDEGLARSAINVTGSVTGLPSAQINRTVQGFQAMAEGETTNPAALAFGFSGGR